MNEKCVVKRLPDGSVFINRKELLKMPKVKKQFEAARKLSKKLNLQ